MKVMAGLFIKTPHLETSLIEERIKEIQTYVHSVDRLVVFDVSGSDNPTLESSLSNLFSCEYLPMKDEGEAVNWRNAMIKATFEQHDYLLLMEEGFLFEGEAVDNMKKFIGDHPETVVAVITPRPLYSIEHFEKAESDHRSIMGCRLVGTMIATKSYQSSKGFRTDFHQGYVDYEYCLQSRANNASIVYMENETSRNSNFTLVDNRFLGMKFSMYEKNAVRLYYETRNRHVVWDEYAFSEPVFVEKDKKSFKHERREIRICDPRSREKQKHIRKGINDYKQKTTGKTM